MPTYDMVNGKMRRSRDSADDEYGHTCTGTGCEICASIPKAPPIPEDEECMMFSFPITPRKERELTSLIEKIRPTCLRVGPERIIRACLADPPSTPSVFSSLPDLLIEALKLMEQQSL